jgi:hypothetical protein
MQLFNFFNAYIQSVNLATGTQTVGSYHYVYLRLLFEAVPDWPCVVDSHAKRNVFFCLA